MTDPITDTVIPNAWGKLRRFTQARIALGRAGSSLPTQPHLAFQFAHARARDAVHHPLDIEPLRTGLAERGMEVVTVHSAAPDRPTYLKRPDLGRKLDDASRARLETYAAPEGADFDVAFVIADGLSAFAIEQNALPFLDVMLPRFATNYSIAPLVISEQARVAIGDEIAVALRARMVVVLIGERPGLSSPDSMGLYLSWQPEIGMTDAHRNCISNVRREGMSFDLAAHKLLYLMTEARGRRISGVSLKDEVEAPPERLAAPAGNFLIEGA
ncbi:ethanolamine ammonia-lyase subunit EutC [Azoarcus sp. KH32C]|uniref:ethanolamine ammonia-lyase subunit EutC n=1 Tax=Azoarcus sp. KH32C TaxID=748247 RepID=UPI0002386C8B|nr:ethanolamine ammonia-lyase subunit EutC [Azoarcus sp. KH32C]BAL24902.1 putative ethanolamine ammonia-lyase, small subunit [Azoarcus sp. KH32C]